MLKLWVAVAVAGCSLNPGDDMPAPDAAPVEVDAGAAPDASPSPPDAAPLPTCACGDEDAVCEHLNPDTGAHFVCICRGGAWDCGALPIQIIACVPPEQWECTAIAFSCDYDGC